MNPSNLTNARLAIDSLAPQVGRFSRVSAVAVAAFAGLSVPALHAADLPFQAESFTSSALLADPTQPGFAIFADPTAAPNGAGQYITTLSAAGATPTPSTTATYNLNFPAAGDYTLYVRSLAEGADDGAQGGNDSFFIPQMFGASPTFGNRVNLFSSTTPQPPQFHWVNLVSKAGLEFGGTVDTTSSGLFTVPSAGSQTFVIGGREDGYRIDAFVFSTDGNLSAASLDALANVPEPSIGMLALSGIGGLIGLARRRRG